jgi:glutaredoxin
MGNNRVVVTLFRWAGAWGPFKVKIPCGECSLSKDVILDTLSAELAGIPVDLDIREWLSEWWKPLLKGGWHAPIVMVEGKVIAQGHALNRKVLAQAVIEAYSRKAVVAGNHLFGKESCPHCKRAKGYLEKAGIRYTYHDVVRNPHDLYEMLARVKPIIGPKTPITVPQIWIEGRYIGGANELSKIIHRPVTPNFDRGQCSLSPENQRGGLSKSA